MIPTTYSNAPNATGSAQAMGTEGPPAQPYQPPPPGVQGGQTGPSSGQPNPPVNQAAKYVEVDKRVALAGMAALALLLIGCAISLAILVAYIYGLHDQCFFEAEKVKDINNINKGGVVVFKLATGYNADYNKETGKFTAKIPGKYSAHLNQADGEKNFEVKTGKIVTTTDLRYSFRHNNLIIYRENGRHHVEVMMGKGDTFCVLSRFGYADPDLEFSMVLLE